MYSSWSKVFLLNMTFFFVSLSLAGLSSAAQCKQTGDSTVCVIHQDNTPQSQTMNRRKSSADEVWIAATISQADNVHKLSEL